MQSETIKLPWFASVMYHRVVDHLDEHDPFHLSITSDQLDSQLAFLKSKGYQSVDPLQAIATARNSPEENRRQIVLTFDDGYMDFMTHALPVLQKHGFSATVMLVSDQIGGQNAWDDGKARQVPLMGLSEIREARSAGISFGSHSKTHPPLARLDAATAKAEITDSKFAIEDIMGEPVPVFCFPYGSSSPELQVAVQQAGYEAAFGIEQRGHELYSLTRVDGVKANGAGLNWRFRISGRRYRFRNRAYGSKRMLMKLKP